ncbi:MAG: hypothetical protein ACU0E9_02665 [Limimaricola soesokkakensis]
MLRPRKEPERIHDLKADEDVVGGGLDEFHNGQQIRCRPTAN